MQRLYRAAVSACMLVALLGATSGVRADDVPRDAALSMTQASGVTREVLGSGLPTGAPGQELVLLRFTFEPGAVINPHIHPGMQTAYVLSGTLGYTVLCGHALVTLPNTTETQELDAGPEMLLQPGATFTEVEGLVHTGRNAGSGTLVLLVSSLLQNDETASIPVDPNTAPQCAAMADHQG